MSTFVPSKTLTQVHLWHFQVLRLMIIDWKHHASYWHLTLISQHPSLHPCNRFGHMKNSMLRQLAAKPTSLLPAADPPLLTIKTSTYMSITQKAAPDFLPVEM